MVVSVQVEQLRDLLGDSACALGERKRARGRGERPDDADDVDPVVAVEALVLGCDYGLAQDRRDLIEPQRLSACAA